MGAILLGLALFLASVPAAHACSAVLKPVPEVIQESDVILRAKVRFALPAASPIEGRVTFDVLEVMKGTFAGRRLTVAGRITDARPSGQRQSPYQQLDCTRAGGCGGCFAYDYRDGAEYLLMLKGGTPYWVSLAPTNEEVSGAQDPWVLWVKGQLGGKNPYDLDETECRVKGGLWGGTEHGRGRLPGCNPRTTDGGKSCRDSSECQGACVHGKCYPYQRYKGCGIFQDGKVVCVD